MRNGSVGKGWNDEEDHSEFSIRELATNLLKDKLIEIFCIAKENHLRNKENASKEIIKQESI